MPSAMGWSWGEAAAVPVINLTISVDTLDVNIFTLAGSPTSSCIVNLTINAGVWIGSSGSGPGLRTGGFPAGSAINIINHGTISAKGGSGNAGAGSDALQLDDSYVTIDNTDGYIFGPGGGGARGASQNDIVGDNCGGGGGGGGQGFNGGAAGAKTVGAVYPGTDGTAGTKTSNGSGGARGTSGFGQFGGKGGGGGGFGSNGRNSGNSENGNFNAGGAAGKAIKTNSRPYTITAGNNSTQIVGDQAP